MLAKARKISISRHLKMSNNQEFFCYLKHKSRHKFYRVIFVWITQKMLYPLTLLLTVLVISGASAEHEEIEIENFSRIQSPRHEITEQLKWPNGIVYYKLSDTCK